MCPLSSNNTLHNVIMCTVPQGSDPLQEEMERLLVRQFALDNADRLRSPEMRKAKLRYQKPYVHFTINSSNTLHYK